MDIALDHNGPTDTVFEPFEECWVDQGIVPRFLAVVRQRSEEIAAVDPDVSLTYGALAATARAMADRIEAEAPGSGAVGILLYPSVYYWAAALACLWARRPYVALDLHYPPERIGEIMRSANLAAVITDATGAAIVPTHVSTIIASLSDAPPPLTIPAPEPLSAGKPAAILYTSGSTGRPKGVANDEAAILRRVEQYANACHLHTADRFLSLSSPWTIAGVREGMTALLVGARLHVIDIQARSLREITRWIEDWQITIMWAVPSLVRPLISGQPGIAKSLQSLRIQRTGGELVFWSDIRLMRDVLPPKCLIQIAYSSTESTGTQWFVPPDAVAAESFVPVGYILPGVTATLKGEDGMPVAPGDTGELVLSGPHVALGFWEDGKVAPGIIEAGPDGRVLHTGDVASFDGSGRCTILGRKDRQVKINGVRVEPAEVEAKLRDIPEVADAAVISGRIGKQTVLTAFFVPKRPGAAPISYVRNALRDALPTVMRPSRIHPLQEIPRLPTGKADMRTLERLAQIYASPRLDTDTEATPVADDLHTTVRRVWRDILGRRSLATDMTFEEAGGDSLGLMQFVLLLETELGRQLPFDLFHVDMRLPDAVRALREMPTDRTTSEDVRPTIFFLPGLDGDEPRLAAFRSELQDRFHFVVIEYPDWPEFFTQGGGFEMLIDTAVDRISAVQPSGPLLIAGYSFGGDVAFAAASKLIGSGREIAFLGILDTDLDRLRAQAVAFDNGEPVRDRRDLVQELWTAGFGMGLGVILAKCARDVIGLKRVVRYANVWRPILLGRPGFAFHRRMRTVTRLRAQWCWYQSARPKTVDAPTVLFRSWAHDEQAPPDLHWLDRCPNLSVIRVSGDHRTMLDPPHRHGLCNVFIEALEGSLAATTPPRPQPEHHEA